MLVGTKAILEVTTPSGALSTSNEYGDVATIPAGTIAEFAVMLPVVAFRWTRKDARDRLARLSSSPDARLEQPCSSGNRLELPAAHRTCWTEQGIGAPVRQIAGVNERSGCFPSVHQPARRHRIEGKSCGVGVRNEITIDVDDEMGCMSRKHADCTIATSRYDGSIPFGAPVIGIQQ